MSGREPHRNYYRSDFEKALRTVRDWQLDRRLLRRLAALSRRVLEEQVIENHFVDTDLISALDHFIEHVEKSDASRLYDSEQIPSTQDAERARKRAICQLQNLRESWKEALPHQGMADFRRQHAGHVYSKMSISALIN